MAQDLNIYEKYITAGSSSNQIYQDCVMAGSSSQDATETAYPTNRNRTNTGYTYLSSATVQKTYSTNSYSVLNPTSTDLHTRGMRRVATIPADLSLYGLVTASLENDLDIQSSEGIFTDGSVSSAFQTITADKFTTTYSNGSVLVVGDDTILTDVNLQNGLGVIGQQAGTKGWVKFGSGSNAPLVGFNNTDNFPTAGDGIYSVTGSMLIKTNKLYFFNGGASNNGWSQII
jgi:hypothetical protein